MMEIVVDITESQYQCSLLELNMSSLVQNLFESVSDLVLTDQPIRLYDSERQCLESIINECSAFEKPQSYQNSDYSSTWSNENSPDLTSNCGNSSFVLNQETPLFSIQIPYDSLDGDHKFNKTNEVVSTQRATNDFKVDTTPQKSTKRKRIAFTSSQLVVLENEFQFNKYLCRSRRIQLSESFKLSENQITTWFQNRRMKYKKEVGKSPNNERMPPPVVYSKSNISKPGSETKHGKSTDATVELLRSHSTFVHNQIPNQLFAQNNVTQLDPQWNTNSINQNHFMSSYTHNNSDIDGSVYSSCVSSICKSNYIMENNYLAGFNVNSRNGQDANSLLYDVRNDVACATAGNIPWVNYPVSNFTAS